MGSTLWEQKNGNVSIFFFRSVFFFVATYGNEVIFVGGNNKNTDLRNCSRLSKHCTGRDVLKVGLILKFQTRGLETSV